MSALTPSESAIINNAGWFMHHNKQEGRIGVDDDEFYGLRGDATLVGHAVTVRCLAWLLTGDENYLQSARRSLEWLAARQDSKGGWRRDSAFTLDGAQCVFEGFNTYRLATGDNRFDAVLRRAARRRTERWRCPMSPKLANMPILLCWPGRPSSPMQAPCGPAARAGACSAR